jgi:[ribosomal protein S5]-alanine N-acetyltransferase
LALPERITSLPVVLRAFVPDDAARVEEFCSDPAVSLVTAAMPHPYPPGAAAQWIATHDDARAAGTVWTYAITHVDGAELLGAVDLRVGRSTDGNLGYWIGRPRWGNGYATLAVRALIAVAFLGLDIDGLSAAHLARNPASGRVLEKCGLIMTHRARGPHRGGPEEDFRVWSITREQWSSLRGA